MRATRQLQIVILFAFITRLLLLYCFPLHMTDYMFINSAAENLIDGHGMGFIRSSPEDLSAFYFEGLRLWPPLVTATTAILLNITGSYLIADFLLMTILLLGFTYILYSLCKEMGLTNDYIIYVFIVFALNPELIKRPGFSDLAASFFCIWALLLLIKQLKRSKPITPISIFFISLVFFLPSAYRYQYYPVSLLFPICLLISSIYLKEKTLMKWSVISLLIVSLFICSQEYFLFVYSGQPIDQAVAMDKTGFYLFNLQHVYPFFIKTFVNVSYIENTWKNIILAIRSYYYVAAAVFLLILLFYTVRHLVISIRKTKADRIKVKQSISVLSLVPFLLLPVLILIALSLTHNSRTGQPGGWTYVNEGRYYIVPSILLLLLTFWLIQQKWAGFTPVTKRILSSLFIISIVYNLALTVKFYYNAASNNIPDKELTNRADRDAAYNYLQRFADEEIQTVITYNEPYFTFFPYIKNVAVTKKISLLTNKTLQTKKRIRLLIISKKDAPQTDVDFILRYKAAPVFSRPNFVIYSTILEP